MTTTAQLLTDASVAGPCKVPYSEHKLATCKIHIPVSVFLSACLKSAPESGQKKIGPDTTEGTQRRTTVSCGLSTLAAAALRGLNVCDSECFQKASPQVSSKKDQLLDHFQADRDNLGQAVCRSCTSAYITHAMLHSSRARFLTR